MPALNVSDDHPQLYRSHSLFAVTRHSRYTLLAKQTKARISVSARGIQMKILRRSRAFIRFMLGLQDYREVQQLEPRELLSVISGPSILQPSDTTSVAPADLNNDGFVDLVVANSGQNTVTAYLKQMDGAYRIGSVVTLPNSRSVGKPVIFDYDSDNSIDVLVAGSVIRVNEQGDMTFDPDVRVPYLQRERLLDIDQDGYLDLISRTDHTAFAVYFGSPTGLVDRFDFGAGFGPTSELVGIADIDGDGKLDIEFYNGYLKSVMTLRQFECRVFYEVGQRGLVQGEETYDMNGDGRTDYIKITNNEIRIENGANGSCTTSPYHDPIPILGSGLQTGGHYFLDIDRDGYADIVSWLSTSYSMSFPYFISRQSRAGGFSAPAIFTHGSILQTHTTYSSSTLTGFSDLTGDRILDFSMTYSAYVNVGGYPTSFARTSWNALLIDSMASIDYAQGDLIPFNDNILSVHATSSQVEPLTSLDLYLDTNNNGWWDDADELLATKPVTGSDVTTTIPYRIDRDVREVTALFTVARTETGRSDAALLYAEPWTRQFMPEGYRNISNVDEHVPLVNPNDFDVPYKIIVHYETGERDQVVFSGVLPAHSRGGKTLALRGNESISNVRPDTPYSIEVVSRGSIGAMLVRSDTFGLAGARSVVAGESFTASTTTFGTFPGLSLHSLDYVLLFNPGAFSSDVTIDFFDAGQIIATTHRTVEAFRRSGVAVFEVPELFGHNGFSARVSSARPLIMSFSRHEPQQSRGQLSLNSDGTKDFGTIDLTRTQTAQLLLANPFSFPQAKTLRFTTETTQLEVHVTLSSFTARTLDLKSLVPDGSRFVTIRSDDSGFFSARVSATDSFSHDAWSFAPVVGEKRWLFADNYLDLARLGTGSAESLQLSNTTSEIADVTLKFLEPNGDVTTVQRTLAPLSAISMNLHELPELTSRPTLRWFSTMIESDRPISASLLHTDVAFGGTWASSGLPWR